MEQRVSSSCPYCGVGCRLIYVVEDGKVIKTERDPSDPISKGVPCIKGLTSYENIDVNRVKKPLIRENKEDDFKEVSYEEAYSFLINNIKGIDAGSVGFTGSGQMTNEDNFILSKFARSVFGSSNIDCCARLCHAATTTAMRKLFGNPAMPNYIDDLEKADVVFSIGTNPATNYPVAFQRIRNAKKGGLKYICADISQSMSGVESSIFIPLKYSYANPFILIICKRLVEEKAYLSENEKKEGWVEFVDSLKSVNSEDILKNIGIGNDEFEKVYQEIKAAKNLALMHGMGITQHQNGVDNVVAILSLAQLKGAMIIPMRGKINVQGAGDMGTCPDWVPFGGSPSETKEKWGEIAIDTPGHHMTDFMYSEKTKVLFLMGDSPAQSMPELNTLHKKLQEKFIVVFHHHKSLTMEFANIVFPVTNFGEVDGTITNAERRVRPVRKFIDTEDIRPAWKVLSEVAALLGKEELFDFKNSKDIFNEIISTIPPYADLNWDSVFNSDDNFAEKDKYFERFIPVEATRSDPEEEKYPFLLTTRRSPFHFCSGDETRSSKTLIKMAPQSFVGISKEDAEDKNFVNGDKVRLKSRYGEIEVEVKIEDKILKGILSGQFHYEDVLINKLFGRNLDPVSGTPNLKSVGVDIEKV